MTSTTDTLPEPLTAEDRIAVVAEMSTQVIRHPQECHLRRCDHAPRCAISACDCVWVEVNTWLGAGGNGTPGQATRA